MLALKLTTTGNRLVFVTEPAKRLTQEWLYRPWDVDLRFAKSPPSVRSLVGWKLASIDAHDEKRKHQDKISQPGGIKQEGKAGPD